MSAATELTYLVSTALFIFSLKWMSDPKTARRGVFAGVVAMALAVGGTLIHHEIVTYRGIAIAFVLGTIVGVPLSWVPLTAVPQRTALSHAFGGLAAGLVGTAKYYLWLPTGELTTFRMAAIAVEIILGYLTCTGSLMAAGKLQEVLPTRPITYRNQNFINFGLFGLAVVIAGWLVVDPSRSFLFPVLIVLALVVRRAAGPADRRRGHADGHLAAQLVRGPRGRGDGVRDGEQAAHHRGRARRLVRPDPVDHHVPRDEPVVHERPVRRVRAGAGGQRRHGEQRTAKSATAEDAAQILENASSVVIIPGYGMAVAQAQHRIRDLYEHLAKRGVDVRFAIHPVAGRMPGHMNVLLAEAEIPYDRLVEMDDINPDMPQVDVALVVGANDVVNPAARHDSKSPIFGMPIIDADKAKTVMAIKRSMNPGFAGIENELYFADNTLMLFGDAKVVVGDLVKQMAGGESVH